jgi:hypothetical protein
MHDQHRSLVPVTGPYLPLGSSRVNNASATESPGMHRSYGRTPLPPILKKPNTKLAEPSKTARVTIMEPAESISAIPSVSPAPKPATACDGGFNQRQGDAPFIENPPAFLKCNPAVVRHAFSRNPALAADLPQGFPSVGFLSQYFGAVNRALGSDSKEAVVSKSTLAS